MVQIDRILAPKTCVGLFMSREWALQLLHAKIRHFDCVLFFHCDRGSDRLSKYICTTKKLIAFVLDICLRHSNMMPRWHYGVFVLLLLHAEPLYAFVSTLCPPRHSQRNTHGEGAATLPTAWPCSSSQLRVPWTANMLPDEHHVLLVSPPELQTSAATCNNISNSWVDTTRKALMLCCLTAAVVLSGIVPALQLESGSTEQNCLTVTTVRHEQLTGVPTAVAASFNDEQRAIAETWVGAGLKFIIQNAASSAWTENIFVQCWRSRSV